MGGSSSRASSFSGGHDAHTNVNTATTDTTTSTSSDAITAVFEHPDMQMRLMAESVLARIFTYGGKDISTISKFSYVQQKWQNLLKKQIQVAGEIPDEGMKLVAVMWKNAVLRTPPAVEHSVCAAIAKHTVNSQQRTMESTDPYQNVFLLHHNASNKPTKSSSMILRQQQNSLSRDDSLIAISGINHNNNNNNNNDDDSNQLFEVSNMNDSFNKMNNSETSTPIAALARNSRASSQIIRPDEIEEQPDEKVKSGKKICEDFIKLCRDPRSPLWIIEKLIYKGRIDLNYRALTTNNTALITAVDGANVRVVPTLVAGGARIDKRGAHGTTALIVACKRGDVTLARFLIDHGADPTLHDSLGTNCVSACILSDSSAEILEMLIATKKIDWDASPKSPATKSVTPMQTSINNKTIDNNQNENFGSPNSEFVPRPGVMANSALGLAITTAIAQAALNVKTPNNNNNNNGNSNNFGKKGPPLLEACRLGASEKVVKMILSAGANPNAVEPSNGVTALLAAVKTGRTDLAKVLIAAGADVNKSSSNSVTPLMSACVTGDVESAKFLISKGASLNVRDHDGHSALQLAKNHNCPDIIALLRKHGALE